MRLLADAKVDFLILETFFHLEEMLIAIECGRASDLPIVATMTFRPKLTECSDGHSPAQLRAPWSMQELQRSAPTASRNLIAF